MMDDWMVERWMMGDGVIDGWMVGWMDRWVMIDQKTCLAILKSCSLASESVNDLGQTTSSLWASVS